MTTTEVSINNSGEIPIAQPTFTHANVKRAKLTAVGPNPDPTKVKEVPLVNYSVVFPYGPSDLNFQQYSGVYSQVARPYQKPLNLFSNPALRTVTFNAVIANPVNGGLTQRVAVSDSTVQGVVDTLETISQTGAVCSFKYGVSVLPFKCFLSQFSYVVQQRSPRGVPLRITASLQLTEYVNYSRDVELLPGIIRPPVNVTVPSGGSKVKALTYEDIPFKFSTYDAVWKSNVLAYGNANNIGSFDEAVVQYNLSLGDMT